MHARGYSFVDVKPEVNRDPDKHTIDVIFNVDEGQRLYVERIDIVGNMRTKDKVIRREFRLAEGDPFSAEAARRSRQRLQDLGYFNTVTIQPSPGSTPDKTVLTTTVQEKSTGSVTIGGGYATDAGALVDAGISENNLIGTGISACDQRRAGAARQLDQRLAHRPVFPRPQPGGRGGRVPGADQLPRHRAVRREARGLRAAHGLRLQRPPAPGLELFAGRANRVQCRVERQLLHPGRGRLHAAVAGQPATDPGLPRQPDRSAQRRRLYLGHRFRRTGRQRRVRPHPPGRQVLHSAGTADGQSGLGAVVLRRHRIPVQPRPAGAVHRPLLPGRRQPARLPDRRRRSARYATAIRSAGGSSGRSPPSCASRCRCRPTWGCPGGCSSMSAA